MLRRKQLLILLIGMILGIALLYPQKAISEEPEVNEAVSEFNFEIAVSSSEPLVERTDESSEDSSQEIIPEQPQEMKENPLASHEEPVLELYGLGNFRQADVEIPFRPIFSQAEINNGLSPRLDVEQDWVTHSIHFSARHFFMTYIQERMPPIGYEVGSEARLIIPSTTSFSDSAYYRQELLGEILRHQMTVKSGHQMIDNPRKQVWLNDGRKIAFGTSLTDQSKRHYVYENLYMPGEKTTPDGVFAINSRLIGASLEITVRRLIARPSDQRTFTNFNVRYAADYVMMDWSASRGWYRQTFNERHSTGNFNPKINFSEREPVLQLAKIKDGVLEYGEAFNENPADYIRVAQGMRLGQKTMRFITQPDTSRFGPQTVEVEVTDTYGAYRKVERTSVTFDVRNSLAAEAVPQRFNLGQPLETIDLKDLVTNVTIKGEPVPEKDYNVRLIRQPNLNVVGNETWLIGVSYQDLIQSEIEIAVPVTVLWGETINLLGANFQNVMGISLNRNSRGELVIKGNRGATRQSSSLVHPNFPDEYIRVGVYRLPQQITAYPDGLETLSEVSIKGEDPLLTAHELVKEQIVAVGDIIGIAHREVVRINRMVELYQNSQVSLPYNADYVSNVSYYEITANGFLPLTFNQLRMQTVEFNIFTPFSVINSERREFVHNQGLLNRLVTLMGNYPRTNQAGDSEGTLIARETLRSNQMIDFTYAITAHIRRGTLAMNVPELLEFNDYQITNSRQIVRRKVPNWQINVRDSRGDDPQSIWRIQARIKTPSSQLGNYYVFEKDGKTTNLSEGVEVYRSTSGSRQGIITTGVSWQVREGPQIDLPSLPPLRGNQLYQDVIEWQLIEGP